MIDKRQLVVGSPSCVLVFVLALAFFCCFSFRLLDGDSSLEFHTEPMVPVPKFALVFQNNDTHPPPPYDINELPLEDESTLIDVKDFRFTINHDYYCNKSQPFLLVIVHSAPNNDRKRQVIRETWGQKLSDIILLFMVGTSEEYQSQLEEENSLFGDLIQGNFVDDYRNMTYKHTMALKWSVYYCPSAKYVLKVDDDVYINMTGLLNYIKNSMSPWGARRLIFCETVEAAKVKRTYRSKWRVSTREFSGKIYPTYCSGFIILYSPDVVFSLYREAQRGTYFWIDDVYITGILAKKVALTQASLSPQMLKKSDMSLLLDSQVSPSNFIFGPPNLDESEIKALHSFVESKMGSDP